MKAKDFILRQKTHKERWVFTDEELRRPHSCHASDNFIAYPPPEQTGTEVGVIVYRNGVVSHLWADGTKGVPEDVRQLADDVDALHEYDPDGDTVYADSWYDVEVDQHGTFIGFIDQPRLRS